MTFKVSNVLLELKPEIRNVLTTEQQEVVDVWLDECRTEIEKEVDKKFLDLMNTGSCYFEVSV